MEGEVYNTNAGGSLVTMLGLSEFDWDKVYRKKRERQSGMSIAGKKVGGALQSSKIFC